MDITSLQFTHREPDALPEGRAPRWIDAPVAVVHPSPVTCRPRRGTQQRSTFVASLSYVRIPHADPREFEPVAELPADAKVPTPVYARDRAAWAVLTRNQGEPIRPEELRDFLSERLTDGEALHWLGPCGFRGTPVAASFVPGRPPVNTGTVLWRGESENDLGVVTGDERPGAADALRDWIEGNVVVAGDRVLRRWEPVLYWHPEHNGGNGHGYLSIAPFESGLGTVGILPGTIDRTRELAGSFKMTAPRDPGPGWRAVDAVADHLGERADVALAVNLQAHRLRHLMERRWDRIRDKDPESPDRLLVEKAVLGLRAIEYRAALGLAARGEYRADADAFRSAVALEARLGGFKAGRKSGNAFLHSWIEQVAAPRMDGMPRDDAEAIAGLAF